jgi:uncharacterized protein (TIRG00374 family)
MLQRFTPGRGAEGTMRNRLLQFLRLIISVALVAYLAWSAQVWRAFHPMPAQSWVYIALIAVLINLDRVVMAYKWSILLKAKGVRLPLTDAIRSYYIGTFWGMFLPASVGGDVIRTYRVSAQTQMGKETVSSVVLERVLGVLATLIMGLGSVAALAIVLPSLALRLAQILGLSLIVFIAFFLLSLHRGFARWFWGGLPFRSHKSMQYLAQIYHSYRDSTSQRGALARFVVWSVLEQWFPILCSFLMSRALGMKVPFIYFVVFLPIIVALSRIPISIDGFGIGEGLFVFFFSYAGVKAADAFALGFLQHLWGIVVLLPGILYYSAVPRLGPLAATDLRKE